MIDLAIVVWITLIGAAFLAPLWDELDWGIAGVALPTGAGAYVATALVALAFGFTFSTVAVLIATSVVALGVLVRSRGNISSSRTWLVPAATVAGAFVIGFIARLPNLTRMTVDSTRYLLTADVLETSGSLSAASPFDLRMRHLVTPLLHTPGVVADGPGYSAVITPLFALSGLALVAWLASRAFGAARTPWAVVGALAFLIVTANRFGYHSFYVNGHMFFAVFLLVGVGLAWYATQTENWLLFAPASFGFAALVPLRPEGAITAAIFLVPLLVSDRVPYVQRWRLVVPYVVAAVLWNGAVWAPHARNADLGIGGPVYGTIFIVLGVAAGLGLLSLAGVRRYAQWGPALVGAILAGYLAVKAIDDPAVLRGSLDALGTNIAVEGLWGTLWWIMPILLVTAWLVAPRQSSVALLLAPMPVYAVALLAFTYLRGGAYRVGTGDSGSRMLLHVVLVGALAVVLAVADSGAERDPSVEGDRGL